MAQLVRSNGDQEVSQAKCREGFFVAGFCFGQTHFYVPRAYWVLSDAEIRAAAVEALGESLGQECTRLFRKYTNEGWCTCELPPFMESEGSGDDIRYHPDEEPILRFIACLDKLLIQKATT